MPKKKSKSVSKTKATTKKKVTKKIIEKTESKAVDNMLKGLMRLADKTQRKTDQILNELKNLNKVTKRNIDLPKQKFNSDKDLNRVTNEAKICSDDCKTQGCSIKVKNNCWKEARKIIKLEKLIKSMPYTYQELLTFPQSTLLMLCGYFKINPFSLPNRMKSTIAEIILEKQNKQFHKKAKRGK